MINRDLPVEELKERFAREQRVLIDSILDPGAAEALYECLLREIPWELVFRRGTDVITLTGADLDRLPAREREQMMRGIQAQAQQDFQFVYWKFSMVDAYRRQVLPQLITHRLLEAIASQATIELLRTVTGFSDISRVDAQATLYRPGNFLTAQRRAGRRAQSPRCVCDPALPELGGRLGRPGLWWPVWQARRWDRWPEGQPKAPH